MRRKDILYGILFVIVALLILRLHGIDLMQWLGGH